MKRIIAAICLTAALGADGAAKWRNLDDKAHIAGEKLTESDLRGRVVLVYYWAVSQEYAKSMPLLDEAEKAWNAFKTKKFRVVGSYLGARNKASESKIKEALAKYKVTFPVYHNFSLDPPSPGCPGGFFVVNHRGAVVVANTSIKKATAAAVNAMDAIGMPVSLVGDVEFRKFKSLEKKFTLGKNVTSVLKSLKRQLKSKDSDISAEAQAIISAVESAKNDVKEDIATYREVDPAEALKLIQLYLKTWPDDTEAADYKAAMPELKKAAAGRAKEEKAKAKGKAK